MKKYRTHKHTTYDVSTVEYIEKIMFMHDIPFGKAVDAIIKENKEMHKEISKKLLEEVTTEIINRYYEIIRNDKL